MSKSTKDNSSKEESKAGQVPKSIIERVKLDASFAIARFGIPLLPFVSLYCDRSDMGRKKVEGHNPLWLKPEGSERALKSGYSEFPNEAECYNRQARRWFKLDWTDPIKTMKELGITIYTLEEA